MSLGEKYEKWERKKGGYYEKERNKQEITKGKEKMKVEMVK